MNVGARNMVLSITALHERVCWIGSKQMIDAPFQMQHIDDADSVVHPHRQHIDRTMTLSSCMFAMSVTGMSHPLQVPPSPDSCQKGSEAQLRAGGDSLEPIVQPLIVRQRHDKATSASQIDDMADPSRACEREATPAKSPPRHDGAFLASIVGVREAQVALVSTGGDAALVASLRSIDVGGSNSSELDTLTSLGRKAGICVKASTLVGRDRRIDDVTVKRVPNRSERVYVVLDSTLKLKAGSHGPRIAVPERLKPYGVKGVRNAPTSEQEHNSGRSPVRLPCILP